MEVEKKAQEGVAGKPFHFGTWVAVRRPFRVDSPFFAAGNVERELLAKQVLLYLLCLALRKSYCPNGCRNQFSGLRF